MATELIFAEERQNKILSMLKAQNKLLVNELCEQFSVSSATIRNDLNQLEKKGLLKRTHGGAIPCSKAGFEPTSSEKIRTRAEQKQAIAQYALSLIENGDTIALDTGTTTYCLAELLSSKQNITVITTDTRIAALLEAYPGISVIIAGGALRKGFSCTTGAITNSILSMFNVDKVFMAANAITPSGYICTPDLEQAKVKQSLIAMANQRFLLCDSTKFGAYSLAKFGSLDDITTLITDNEADTHMLSVLRAQGVSIVTV